MPEQFSHFAFTLDHVIARKHRGRTSANNLALACGLCNTHKGPNVSGVDPVTRRICDLYHPRHQRWEEHFAWRGIKLVGRTATGRVTIVTLNMNSPEQLLKRKALIVEGQFPPQAS